MQRGEDIFPWGGRELRAEEIADGGRENGTQTFKKGAQMDREKRAFHPSPEGRTEQISILSFSLPPFCDFLLRKMFAR
jgi:hypothetical protein